MASKKADTSDPQMASTPGQQSWQKPTIRGKCQGVGQRETPEPEPQNFAVGEQSLFRSPGINMEAGLSLRANERQPVLKDEDTMVSLDLYIESLEVDAKEGGVIVPPSPRHSATDNSVDMYYGLEETALFPTSTVSTPPPASTAGLSTATRLPAEVSNKAAAKELLPDGESMTSSSSSSAAASHLAPESHSRAKSHSARVHQSGRPHHAKDDQFSTKSLQAEGRSCGDGSQKPGSAEYQQLLEKYRTLRRNMVSLCYTAQREMQNKLQTISELRAALDESQRSAGGGGVWQPGAWQGPNPGSDALLRGDPSMPARPLSFASEETNLQQSASCLSVSSRQSAKSTEDQNGVTPSTREHVSAKFKILSSVSTQAQLVTTAQTASASTQTSSLKSLNKRVQTDSGKQVKRHTQTDLLRSVHELIQTESSVTLDKLLQTDLLGLVDKPVQTDPVNNTAVDKQIQTHPPRCVSNSGETDLLVDVAVDKSTLTDSQKPGNVNKTDCTDSAVEVGMEDPPQHHSPNHIDDQTPAVVNEVPYNSCELKERDKAIEFNDVRHSPSYPDQVAQGEVLQQAWSRGSKRHLEPSSRSEYVESKRARRRMSSDECQTRYSSDNNDDVFFNQRHASEDSNLSVDVKSLSDQYSPAYGEEASAKMTAEQCENVGIMSSLHTGSASGVIVSEPHKVSGQSFQNTADSMKQMSAKAAPVQVCPKKHSPSDTEREHCFTQDHVDAAPCQAGQGAKVVHCSTQPLRRPWVWGPLKDVRGVAWKRRLLFWPSYTHRRVSRRSEIDAVFCGENHPKEYDWSGFNGSSLELEQEPPEQDQTQRHAPSHLQADWTPYEPQLEDLIEEEKDSLHQPVTSPDLAADEGHSAMFDASIPVTGNMETDDPNLTPSVSTSSATGSVHKHKKKKKKKDKKKSRHSVDKAEEKKEKRKKKQKKKDDPSMKDDESVGLQERGETDLRQLHGMTVSNLNFVDAVDQRDFVQDADGITVVREMGPDDEGNDSNVYSKTNVLSSVEDDIDRKMAPHPEITSEILKNALEMKAGITDHEERALCTNPKDKELIDKMAVNTSQEEDRDVVHEMTVNTVEDSREKDRLSVINTSQDNHVTAGSSEACTDSSEEEQFPCDKRGNADSDFSIHTDDSDSEEWSVEKSAKHVSHQSLNTKPSSETTCTCADNNTLLSENEPGILCNEIVVGRGEAVTVDETSHHTGFFSVTKDISVENDGDTSASVCADDLKGPGEEGNMGMCSNDSACVNEVEKLKDGFRCEERTFESVSNNVVEGRIKLTPSSMAAEDDVAEDKLQTDFSHEHTSLENVLNVPTNHTFGVCENNLYQKHDDIGQASEGESADQPWAHLPSNKAGSADHREGGKQVTFVPHHRGTTSQGDAYGLLTTRKETAPEEENTTSTNLSGIPTTPVGSYQLPVTPKKNWLLRTKLAVEGEDSTSLFSTMKSACTRDLSDPSFIWSPDKTSSNHLSLREPIGHDTFYNMLGMPCNSSTSSDESLARNIPFTNPPPLELVKYEGVLEKAKPSQPILSSQQTSDFQIPGNQSHLENQLDMGVEEEVEEVERDTVRHPAGTEDKTPLFGYPSAGLRDSTAHRFAYKRKPLHLPPSSSSSASSVTASRSSSLTSASLSSLPTEPPPTSQMLTNRASQKSKTVKEDSLLSLVQGDRGVKDEEISNSSGLLSTSRASLSGNTSPSGKGVLLVSPQTPDEMIQSERKELLCKGSSGQKSQIMDVVVEEADESLKEASDSAHRDSHKVTSQMGAYKEQPVPDFSLQNHQSDHVNIAEDADSKMSSVAELRASTSAIHLQRKDLEEGEIDSRDSLCPTPKAVAGNSKGSFTSTLRDITEQSLEEGEIQSSDESDANDDQNLSCDDVKICVQSDDFAESKNLKVALTHKSKRRLSPDTSREIKPSSKKQKTRTEKASSDAHSGVQTLGPKAAAPKSSSGKDREQKAGHVQSEAEHSDDKENGQVDQQAQQRRQRNRDKVERVRRQIVGYKPFQKEHSELKSFTIPKKNRGADSAQLQKDQNWTPENTLKASSHKYSDKKGVKDSVELSKCDRRKETGREKDDQGRRLGMEKDHRERRASREKDSSDRRLGEERDVRRRKYSEESDGRHRRSSEDREVRHRRYSEERDPRHRRDSHDKERDLRHSRYSQEREGRHRRLSDEREGRHRRHSEERENRHGRHSEEREHRYRRHSEEKESRHGRHSKERDRHGRYSEERDCRYRRDSEERDSRDRRGSKGRDVCYERRSKERDGRLRRPSGEKDGRHRRHSKERDSGYSRRGDERYRELFRHKDSGIERHSKESDAGDSAHSREKCGRDRGNSREGSDKDVKCAKERDNKDTSLRKSVDDKNTRHGRQTAIRQESEHQSAAKHSTKSVDTGGKLTMSKADMSSVASPRLSASSVSPAHGCPDNSAPLSPAVTCETEYILSQSTDDRSEPKHSADGHHVPTNCVQVDQVPSESSEGSMQLFGASSVKEKQSPNEESSEKRPLPQKEMILTESHDLGLEATKLQSTGDVLDNGEHFSDPCQSEEETESDGNFSVSDSYSECSDSLTDPEIEGSIRTRGFLYYRDPLKPRPELEMSIEELEEQENDAMEEQQTGYRSEENEDSEHEDDSCDEDESGEENMSEDDVDDDNEDGDENQSKPYDEADNMDTDDNGGDSGKAEGCDEKSCEHQDTRHDAEDSDAFCQDSDSEMADDNDFPHPTAVCTNLCAEVSVHPGEKTSAFSVFGPDQQHTAKKRCHSSGNRRLEKPAPCTDGNGSGEGSDHERLIHPVVRHCQIQSASPPGHPVCGQMSSESLSLHPSDDVESFLLGDLSHPQGGGGKKTAVGDVWGCSLGSRIAAERSSPQ